MVQHMLMLGEKTNKPQRKGPALKRTRELVHGKLWTLQYCLLFWIYCSPARVVQISTLSSAHPEGTS